ncbi:hypothetical protein KYT24_004393 [Salmonella enterica]|nr:hypothetical protein [Salmonella enterica]
MSIIKKAAAAAAIATLLAGCAVQKQMVATGGSKADGTVTMSYEYGLFEAPKVDSSQAIAAAAQRCKAWGYTTAEPFGGVTKVCSMQSGGDCMQYTVNQVFQCQ